jgi:hypothetical protein
MKRYRGAFFATLGRRSLSVDVSRTFFVSERGAFFARNMEDVLRPQHQGAIFATKHRERTFASEARAIFATKHRERTFASDEERSLRAMKSILCER